MLMFLQKLRKSKKGYTLTELIVVVAILGVLAAVATPLITGQISKAKSTADTANARTIENIVRIKIADEGTFPTGDDADIGNDIYTWVIQSLGEMPEPQQSGVTGFYIKIIAPHDVQLTSGTDYVEIKKKVED